MNGLEDTYKAAFKSTNEYKKELDKELRGQTQNKWELEHQTKRSTNYETSVAKIIKEIADLKYRIPKIGMSCLSFRSTRAFFFSLRWFQSVICCYFLSPQSWSADFVCQGGFCSTQCATSSLLKALWGIKRGPKPESFARCMEVTWQS